MFELFSNIRFQNGQIVLNSMHKFQPRIHLVIVESGAPHVPSSLTDLSGYRYKTWVFPQTVFTAVTAYQNQLVQVAIIVKVLIFILLDYKIED